MITTLCKNSALTATACFLLIGFNGAGPAFADGLKKISLAIGTGTGCGQSSTKIVDKMFTASSPKVHALLGCDLSLSYRFTDQIALSIRNCADWYRPGDLSIINDYLLIAGKYRFSALPTGFFIGAGCGPGFITYPFDRYWRRHYGAAGFAAGVTCGYRLGKKLELTIDDLFSMPQERIRLESGLPETTFMYLLNDIRLTVYYTLP